METTLDLLDPVAEYQALWRVGPPDLDAFLTRSVGMPVPDVVAVLCEDQEQRWRRGDRVPCEIYFGKVPSLRNDPEYGPDLVYHEYLLRLRLGDPPPVQEIVTRFPDFAAVLAAQINVHDAVEDRAEVLADWPDIPGYDILAELGRGGMGIVFKARQKSLDRVVAVKLLRGSALEGEAIARFRAEALILARLQHPNIVQIFEVGEARQRGGEIAPYLAMEYVPAGTLADRLRRGIPSARESAELVALLAQAVEAAHTAGVIHRDLKPANVLLAGETPKLTDFGLAKRNDASHATTTGAILGTPAYMAPEQARGEAHRVGPATDVYALGGVLYECLTGRPAFGGATVMETLSLVISSDPVPARRLRPDTPQDLETIARKCLEKDPSRRFASAREVADDLQRYLDGRPIIARPISRTEQVWRWTRRNPVAAGLVAALFAAILIGAAGIAWQWRNAVAAAFDADERRADAEDNARRAERGEQAYRAASYVGGVNASSTLYRDWNPDALDSKIESLVPKSGEIDLRGFEWHYLKKMADGKGLANWRAHERKITGLEFSPDGRTLATAGRDGVVSLWKVPSGELIRNLYLLPGRTGIAFQWRDDHLFVKEVLPDTPAARDGRIQPGAEIEEIELEKGTALQPKDFEKAIAFLRHTSGVAAALVARSRLRNAAVNRLRGSVYQKVRLTIRNPTAGKAEIIELVRQGVRGNTSPLRMAYSPAGGEIAVAGDSIVWLYDAADGRQKRRWVSKQPKIGGIAWSPDGRHLATASIGAANIVLWNHDGKQVRVIPSARIRAVTEDVGVSVLFAPRSDRVGIGAVTEMPFFDTNTGKLVEEWTSAGFPGALMQVAFSPDGALLASSGGERPITIWDAAAKKPLRWLSGHNGSPSSLAWSRDQRLLVSGGYDQTVRLWDPYLGLELAAFRGHRDPVFRVAITPDGGYVASSDSTGHVILWDVKKPPTAAWKSPTINPVRDVVFAPDGSLISAGATGEGPVDIPTAASNDGMGIDPPRLGDGVSPLPGELRGWNAKSGDLLPRLQGDPRRAESLTLLDDGRTLVAFLHNRPGLRGGEAEFVALDIRTGKRIWQKTTSRKAILTPDGKHYLEHTADYDGRLIPDTIVVRDRLSGAAVASFAGPMGWCELRFTRDNRHLLVQGVQDGTVAVREVGTWREIALARIGARHVGGVDLSPDGKTLLLGTGDIARSKQTPGDVILWDVEKKAIRKEWNALHPTFISIAEFDPTGTRLLTGGQLGDLRVADGQTGELLFDLPVSCPKESRVERAFFSPDGKRIYAQWYLEYPRREAGIVALDLATRNEIWRSPTVAAYTTGALILHPNGKELLSGYDFGRIAIHDAANGNHRRDLIASEGAEEVSGHKTEVTSVAVSPDGKWLATGALDRTVKIWDRATGLVAKSLLGHSAPVRHLAFASDGRTLVSGSGGLFGARLRGEVIAWHFASGKPKRTLATLPYGVTALALAADGKSIAVGTDRKRGSKAEDREATITLFDLYDGRQIRHWQDVGIRRVQGLAFSPKGETLFACIDLFDDDANQPVGQALEAWDVDSGKSRRRVRIGQETVLTLAVSPDGRTLATGGSNQPIRLWHAEILELLLELRESGTDTRKLVFSRDGRALAAGHGDWSSGSITVWRTD